MRTADLASGVVEYELFVPDDGRPAPLVIILHGFSRSRANMRDWGVRLSQEGFVAVVPTLPTWANHRRNAASVVELMDHLCADRTLPIDRTRIALVGHSAGGLCAFLAAADNDRVNLWIGLDPVDRYRQAVEAAPRVRCRVVALLAEPSGCNKRSNWTAVQYAPQSRALTLVVTGAVHSDCESPTDRIAELACGKSDPSRRQTFKQYTIAALRDHLLQDPRAQAMLAAAGADGKVRRFMPSQDGLPAASGDGATAGSSED
ncbi:MAG: alpha/beta fold hydrolase [Phycisphaerae bacterium]|nr:alpha/beta fold hydrolase [Phycisphaerae bacterium]